MSGLSLAPDVDGPDTTGFFAGVEFDRLPGDRRPLESMEELAIPDLTPDEVADLLAMLRE
jgi:hypothetical protein